MFFLWFALLPLHAAWAFFCRQAAQKQNAFQVMCTWGEDKNYMGHLNLNFFASWWQLWASSGDAMISFADLIIQAWTYVGGSVFTLGNNNRKSVKRF